MTDTYLNLVNSGFTKKVAKQLGLPQPAPLRRYEPGQPLLDGPVLVLGARRRTPTRSPASCRPTGTSTCTGTPTPGDAVRRGRPRAHRADAPRPAVGARARRRPACSRRSPTAAASSPSRAPPRADDAPAVAAARQGVDGLLRSLAKELRGGATGNGLVLADGRRRSPRRPSSARCGSSCPTTSAFVDGQLLAVDSAAGSLPGRLGPAARRPGRRRHRRRARHRRGDRRHARPRRRHRRRASTCPPPGEQLVDRRQPRCAAPPCSSTSRPTTPGAGSSSTPCSGTGGSTSSCTTPGSPATSCSPT